MFLLLSMVASKLAKAFRPQPLQNYCDPFRRVPKCCLRERDPSES